MQRYTLSDNITSKAPTMPYRRQVGDPVHRSLRIFTQDPGASRYDVPVTEVRVPWEVTDPGPNGSIFVVDDRNDTRQETYAPIDLDSVEVLRGQGLSPSTTDPRFAQQMVYALAMSLFQRFTLALGRIPDLAVAPQSSGRRVLTIRPHAAEDDNAYYDGETATLDFGYVFATADAGGRLQKGAVVFTSLSHDIVLHETTHALLDGMRPLFMAPSNPDVAAFHEAFADLVALLSRFQYRELVERAIEDSGATLSGRLLTEVARQWGRSGGSGREALRRVVLEAGDPEEPVAKKHRYDPKVTEEHDRGAILVAAVFEAMNRVFIKKTRHIQSLAETPHAPRGAAVALLAREAQKLASDFLNILIRSVDFCPPMDLTFGEFLRAVITADVLTVPEDPSGYREALVHAFRRYGIRVGGVADLSEESLVWRMPERPLPRVPGLAFSDLVHVYDPGWPAIPKERIRRAEALGDFVTDGRHPYFGVVPPGKRDGMVIEPPVIQSIRSLRRLTPDRELDFHMVAEITQRRRSGKGHWFYGGSTVILDESGLLRYIIGKGVMNSDRETTTDSFLRNAPASYRAAAAGKRGAKRAMLRQWHKGRS